MKPPWLVPALLLALWLPACKPPVSSNSNNELSVGVVLPLTGRDAAYGVACRSGIELGIRELNREGRPHIRAVYMDDQSNAEDAALAAERLVTWEKVHVLLGEVSSSASLAMTPVAERARTPLLAPAATAAELASANDWVFQLSFDDPAQARAMARFAKEQLALGELAVLRDLSSQYSIGLAAAFSRAFTELGGKVLLDEAFDRNDESIVPVLDKLIASGARSVYLPLYHQEVGRVTSQLGTKSDDKFLFLGADGWDTQEILALGQGIEGSHFTAHFAPDEPRAEVSRFLAAFEEVYNERPDSTAALGYDAIHVIAAAARITPGLERARLQKALFGGAELMGVTGPITLNRGSRGVRTPVILKIAQGQRVYAGRP